jgi:hypothetical protein
MKNIANILKFRIARIFNNLSCVTCYENNDIYIFETIKTQANEIVVEAPYFIQNQGVMIISFNNIYLSRL